MIHGGIAIGGMLLTVCSVLIAVSDIRRRIIPDVLVIVLFVGVLLYCGSQSISSLSLSEILICAFWPILLLGMKSFSPPALGWGDIKLSFPLSLLIVNLAGKGSEFFWSELPIFLTVCGVVIISSLISIFYGMKNPQSIPHGFSMIVASLLYIVTGLTLPNITLL